MGGCPRISDAEWEVMQVVWRESPISAAEVTRRLATSHDWSPRTIKTMLSRLIGKGALSFRTVGNRYLYSPAVTREECIRQASRSFLQRTFAGDSALALLHLVEQADLSDDEIERLRSLLEEKQR